MTMSPIQAADDRFANAPDPTSMIPQGIYCYGPHGACPFWARDPARPDQLDGYCAFLEEGDWADDGASLLFDQVKECGINDHHDEEP